MSVRLHSHGFISRKPGPHRFATRESKAESRLRMKVLRWLAHGETGLSSECLAFACVGVVGRIDHPIHAGDLGRCIRLLKKVPGLRRRLSRMRRLSKEWAVLVDHWAEIEELWRSELALPPAERPVPCRTYERMQELRL